jgi:hypothetical protein
VDIRASDEDRQRIVAALERHTGAGRLTLDEFAERVQVVHDARTMSELDAIVHDLPVEVDERQRRELFLVFAVAIITLVLLGVFIALR